MKSVYQAVLLLIGTVGFGLYLRSVVLDDLMTTHDDGCMEAAMKLEKTTGDKQLYGFCIARDNAIREFGLK